MVIKQIPVYGAGGVVVGGVNVSAVDYAYLSQWRWHLAGRSGKQAGYVARKDNRQRADGHSEQITVYMHRVVYERKTVALKRFDGGVSKLAILRDSDRFNCTRVNIIGGDKMVAAKYRNRPITGRPRRLPEPAERDCALQSCGVRFKPTRKRRNQKYHQPACAWAAHRKQA